MLLCFLKDKEEQGVSCEIVTYCDRLWLNSDGGIDCIKIFIINNTDTEKSLTRVRMLVPYKNLLEIKDISEKFLDPSFLLTQNSTGGYTLGEYDPIRKLGTITIDGFQNVNVLANNIITTSHLKPSEVSLVEIKNEVNPILPGEFRLIALSFSVSSLLEQMFGKESDTYSLCIDYLDKTQNSQALGHLVGNNKLEIPIKKIFNAETRQGGFDIFLYLPPELSGQDFNADKISESELQFNGQKGEKRQKFLWRGRLLFQDPNIKYLECGKEFEIHGYVRNPHRIRHVEKKLIELNLFLKENQKWFWVGFVLTIIALIKAFWVDICFLFSRFCKIK